MAAEDGTASVLVVDDDPALADAYARSLEDEYDVTTACSGETALDRLDRSIDVVLLDRRMPDMAGDEVLERIHRTTVDPRIALVTAVQPDFDIIEMGIEHYLVKPVDGDTLLETVETLLALDTYRDAKADLSTKQLKRNLLEVEKPTAELNHHDAYRELEADIERLKAEIDAIEADFDGAPELLEDVA